MLGLLNDTGCLFTLCKYALLFTSEVIAFPANTSVFYFAHTVYPCREFNCAALTVS